MRSGRCCVCWRVLAADLECGRDSTKTKNPSFVRLKRDQGKAGTLAEMNGGKLAALAAGLIPSIKAACVRFWLALSFVRFLECAEQNRLKTSPFHAAGSVQIM